MKIFEFYSGDPPTIGLRWVEGQKPEVYIDSLESAADRWVKQGIFRMIREPNGKVRSYRALSSDPNFLTELYQHLKSQFNLIDIRLFEKE